MSKKLIISILLIFILICSSLIHFKATTYNEDGSAKLDVTSEVTESKYGVKHTLLYGTTSATPSHTTEGSQMINEFEMKADGVTSKFVSWAVNNRFGYSRTGLSYIAEDYEKNHPGWIVIAGINADQYFQYYGSDLAATGSFYFIPQPYYTSIMDGERRFASGPLSSGNSLNFAGITNDSSSDPIVHASSVAGFRVEVLNEKNEIIYTQSIDKINESPNAGETSVYFTYNSMEGRGTYINYELTPQTNTYIIEEAELAYMSNCRYYDVGSNYDTYFGRGTISTKTSSNTTIKSGQFAIETYNTELDNVLEIGTKVKVEAYYADEKLNNVESAFGYHSVQIIDNKDNNGSGDYDTRRYNRSIFGVKPDGTYVLMTVAKGNVNGGTYAGTSHVESNAILRYFGVSEAYQQDGGGSVTAIFRNDTGSFDVVSESSDSGTKQRSIFNGCFFVIRDPEYTIYGKDTTRTSIKLTKTAHNNDDVIKDIKVTCNNKTISVDTNEDIIIDGLQEDTEYEVVLSYIIKDNGKEVPFSTTFVARTNEYQPPKPGVSVKEACGTSLTIEQKSKLHFESMNIKLIDGNTKELIEQITVDLTQDIYSYKFNNLTRLTYYQVVVEYQIYDELTDSIKNCVEIIDAETISYDLPSIIKYEITNIDNKKVRVEVEILDEDNVVEYIYVKYSPKNYDSVGTYILESSKETFELEVDLASGEYEFALGFIIKTGEYISPTIKTIDKIDIDEPEVVKPTKKGCKKNSILLLELMTLISLITFVIKKKKEF